MRDAGFEVIYTGPPPDARDDRAGRRAGGRGRGGALHPLGRAHDALPAGPRADAARRARDAALTGGGDHLQGRHGDAQGARASGSSSARARLDRSDRRVHQRLGGESRRQAGGACRGRRADTMKKVVKSAAEALERAGITRRRDDRARRVRPLRHSREPDRRAPGDRGEGPDLRLEQRGRRRLGPGPPSEDPADQEDDLRATSARTKRSSGSTWTASWRWSWCPQGTLAERIRAGGAGIGGFYTPTGRRHHGRGGKGDAA